MTEKRAYTFKPRTSFPIDAQAAGEALEKIKGHNSGDLTPEAVVEAAKDKANPLHAVFEWDDAKAGHQYRVQQAGILIRSVIVTVSGTAVAAEPMSISVSAAQASETAAQVVSAEDLHKQRVNRGWSDLAAWHKQYGALPEFIGVGTALGGFLAAHAAEKQKAA